MIIDHMSLITSLAPKKVHGVHGFHPQPSPQWRTQWTPRTQELKIPFVASGGRSTGAAEPRRDAIVLSDRRGWRGCSVKEAFRVFDQV